MCAVAPTGPGNLTGEVSTGFGVVGEAAGLAPPPNSESSSTIGADWASTILKVDACGLSVTVNPPIFANRAFTEAGLSTLTVNVIFPMTAPRISRIPGWVEMYFPQLPFPVTRSTDL